MNTFPVISNTHHVWRLYAGRAWSALLAALLVLTVLPASAHAVGVYDVYADVSASGMAFDSAMGLVLAAEDRGAVFVRDHSDTRLVWDKLNVPTDVVVAGDGTVYACLGGGNAVLRLVPGGYATVFSGAAEAGYMEGTGGGARFDHPMGIAISGDGTIYVADTYNHCIRTIDVYGRASLFAGTPRERGSVDGALLSASFSEPTGIAFGADGALYIADRANNAIRVIRNGMVETVAGGVGLKQPSDISIHGDTLIIADTGNHMIRSLRNGELRTLLGDGIAGSERGYVNGIRLSSPEAVEVMGDMLYVADTGNGEVLRIPIDDGLLGGRPTAAEIRRVVEHTDRAREATIYLNGKKLARFAPKVVLDGQGGIFVPGRDVCEGLGLRYVWDEKNAAIIVYDDAAQLIIPKRDAIIVDGKALIPIHPLAEVFNLPFAWYEDKMALVVYR